MNVTGIPFDELNFSLSYCYWSNFFSHKDFARNAGMVRGEGYDWPSPAHVWEHAKRGRRCAFCHGAEYFLIQPITLQGVTIKIVHCLCKLLPYMDQEYEFMDKPLGSYWKPSSFDQIKLWGDPQIDAQTKKVINGVKDFIRMPLMWQYLYAGLGAGKTLLAEIVKTELRGLVLFLNMGEFNNLLGKATGRHTLSDLIDIITNADILILDDLGAEYGHPFFYSALYTVVNNRYARREKAPTFITSNLSYAQLATSSSLDYRRIADRISDNKLTNVLASTQPSWRQRK
jgi:hypothetical protein